MAIVGLVLETTNTIPVGLVVVVQVRIVAVVAQAHEVRVVAIFLCITPFLCRTPEVRVGALEVAIPNVVPVASRQRRERERIRAVAITIPPGRGLDFVPAVDIPPTSANRVLHSS